MVFYKVFLRLIPAFGHNKQLTKFFGEGWYQPLTLPLRDGLLHPMIGSVSALFGGPLNKILIVHMMGAITLVAIYKD